MKLNLEKIFFYFMLVIVSGSIGYAIKPAEPVDQKELERKYQNQQQVCTAAIHMMQDFSKKNYYKPKTKKELAIERMMSR
jgi:hypothetical protein